ncbi:hypothetical protein M569_11046, partial [Genlisea aurea]
MACIDSANIYAKVGFQDPTIDANKLSYEIFSILETKFLFGYDYDDSAAAAPPPPPPKIRNDRPAGDGDGEAGFMEMKNQRGRICVLSIDGGGMRNIASGKALAYLESALREKSGNPDARIADYFDVAAGTGVGGIFTAMLFAGDGGGGPLFRAEDTWKFLAEEGGKFYPSASKKNNNSRGGFLRRAFKKSGGGGGRRSSSTACLEKALKEAFAEKGTGRSLTLKDTLKPVLIPCYDLSSAAPFLFSRADALENDGYDFNLWQVCLATSAELQLFEPITMESVDGRTRCVGVGGGVAMSNPTAAAITHVVHNKQEFPFVRGVEDILVLSLGAGCQLSRGSFDCDQAKKWKPKDWTRPLARISGDTSAEIVDHAIAMAFGHTRTANYVRIQPNANGRCGAANSDTDATPGNVRTLLQVGDEMLRQKNVESVMLGGKRIGEDTNRDKLDWIAQQLVEEHRRRSSRIAPTVAFKQ